MTIKNEKGEHMRELRALAISIMLIFSMLALANFVTADGEQASFSMTPASRTNVIIGTNFTVNITVNTTTWIDTVTTDEITFSNDIMNCIDVERGNLFANATIWMNGTINNTAGNITNIVWGSNPPTNTGGVFATLTFEILSAGTGYINITQDKALMAFNMTLVTSNITNNATITTISNRPPDQPTNEHPANGTNYTSIYNRHLNVTVSDPDNNTLTVYFYWGDGTPIAFVSGIQSGHIADINTADYVPRGVLNHQAGPVAIQANVTPIYYWYVNITDGTNTTTSSMFQFNTSVAYDLNEDHYVNILDISILVNEIGQTSVPPGLKRSDINEDGYINILDVSGLVNHIGDRYFA